MANKREDLLTIRTDFTKTGVNTAQARALSDENALWECSNMFSDFRGPLRKMPNVEQIGTDIYEPTSIVPRNGEKISKVFPVRYPEWNSEFTFGDSSTNTIQRSGSISAYAEYSVSSANHVLTRKLFDGDQHNPSATEVTFGFSFKASDLDDPSTVPGGGLLPGGIYIYASFSSSLTVSSYLAGSGVHVKTSPTTWALIPWGKTIAGDGETHYLRFELLSGTLTAFLDGTEIGTCTPYLVGVTSDFYWRVDASSNILLGAGNKQSVRLSGFYMKDSAPNSYVASEIKAAITNKRYAVHSGRYTYQTLIATNRAIWAERDFSGVWTPIWSLPHENTTFSHFRNNVVAVNYDDFGHSVAWEINEHLDFSELDDAPPCSIMVEHKNRLWAAGDPRKPNRVYFSGYRAPNKWFAPDVDADGVETADEVFDAGFLSLKTDSGESISSLEGDFYGQLIVVTDKANYAISGSSPDPASDLFKQSRVSANAGAFNFACTARVGNDLWIAGDQGVTSLRTTDKFGDLMTEKVSAAIQDLFTSSGPEAARADLSLVNEFKMGYLKSAGIVYLTYPEIGSQVANKVMVFNTYQGQWYGPWELNPTFISSGYIGFPPTEVTLFGEPGKVKYFAPFDDPDVAMGFKSPVLDGRSIDPSLRSMVKTWKTLRLVMNPTGHWDTTIRWKVEGEPWRSETFKLAPDNAPAMGSDFKIGRSRLRSQEEVWVKEIDVDAKGRTLKYEVDSTAAASAAFIRCEVDMMPTGHTKE